MAKSSKKSKEIASAKTKPVTTGKAEGGNDTATSAQPAPGKSSKPAKAGAKSRTAAARKTATARKPRTAVPPKKTKATAPAFSDEDVRMRAYFLSEQRQQRGLGGDSAHDWLEAVRQLQAETGAPA